MIFFFYGLSIGLLGCIPLTEPGVGHPEIIPGLAEFRIDRRCNFEISSCFLPRRWMVVLLSSSDEVVAPIIVIMGDEIPVIQGPQGGFHLLGSVRVSGTRAKYVSPGQAEHRSRWRY